MKFVSACNSSAPCYIEYSYILRGKILLPFLILLILTGNTYAQTNTYPQTGNVGIGISNPIGKLQIDGPLDGSISMLRLGTSSSPGNIAVPIGATTGGYNIDFHTWRDIQPDQIGARIRAERINNHLNNSALIQSMDIAFYTSLGVDQSQLTEKLRIKSNGNVGIGTSDPSEKLAVNGIIRSKEVKVEAVNWPDYVFENTYELISLNELADYVATHRHLPGIQSAKESEEAGVSLGEMNAKLLKKIEEITLYIIDQNKRLDRQQEELDSLRKQVQPTK